MHDEPDDERCDYCGRWVDTCNANPCREEDEDDCLDLHTLRIDGIPLVPVDHWGARMPEGIRPMTRFPTDDEAGYTIEAK